VQTQRKTPHHPWTTEDSEKVVKLGFPVRHAERVALQNLAAAHGYTLKDFLLEGADLLHARLERESGHGCGA